MTPHYIPNETYQNNLKAMVVAMMMTDNLDKDEVTFLMNAVDILYSEEDENCKKRSSWCIAEMKNYMKCAERYSSFQDDRCKTYRNMLRSCLQAKKGATSFVPSPSSSRDDLPTTKPCPAFRKHRPFVCDQSVPVEVSNPSAYKPSVVSEAVCPPLEEKIAPSVACDPLVLNKPGQSETMNCCNNPSIPPEVNNPSACKPSLISEAVCPPLEEKIAPSVVACDPLVLNETSNCCNNPPVPLREVNIAPACEPSRPLEMDLATPNQSTCSTVPTEMLPIPEPEPTPVPVKNPDDPNCCQICKDHTKNMGTERFGLEIDDATTCMLEYEEWRQKEQCGCL